MQQLSLRKLLPALLPSLAATMLLTSVAAPMAHAQYHTQEIGTLDKPVIPYEQDEVGVDEKLGSQVPLDAKFIDEDGKTVSLGSFIGLGRPVILWMGYYECPMLCNQMSAGMVAAVKNIKLESGKEFSIINVSIDPNESAGLAAAKKRTYLKELGKPGDAAAWNLLTGGPESIHALANSVGFKFKKLTIDGASQYAHPAVLMVLSPEGKVTRYLYPNGNGQIAFDPQTMRLSLIEASNGQIGSTVDRVLLTCLQYDSHTGKYTWIAMNLMKAAGAVTVLVMAAIFLPLWWKAAHAKPDDDGTGRSGSGAVPA